MKSKNKDISLGCITSFTKCLQYNGCDIPCLGIKNGDYINEVIAIITDKICEIAAPQDLSTLSIQCLIDKFTGITEPLSKTVLSYLQLLINNQCTIKDLIDAINLRIDGITNSNLVLDLKCLATVDVFGNPLPYNEQTVLQALINEVCTHRGQLATIGGQIINLQVQIDNIVNNPPPTLGPVTSCLYANQSIPNAVNITATKVCNLETLYGNASKVNTALSQQCTDLAQFFNTNSNFIQSPSALADSVNNQWVTLCNLFNRLAVVEDCACKVKCSDIKLGWQVNDNEDGDAVTLDFSGDFGNNIPAQFTDCGSTITFIDKDKKKKTYVLSLKQEYTTVEFDLSMLDLSELIVVKVCAKLCQNGETCCICDEQEHLVLSGTCNVCDVTITGSTGSTTITYLHDSHTTTITAVPGEVVYIPKDAENVTYVTNSGDAAPDLGTSCLTITASSLKCYQLHWETKTTQAPLEDAFFYQVRFANNTTAVVSGQYEDYSNPIDPANQLGSSINALNNPSFRAMCHSSDGSSVVNYFLTIRMDEALAPALFVIENPTGVGPTKMFIETVEISDTPCDCSGQSTTFDGGA